MPPVRTSIQRVLSAVVLLAWTTPGVGAVGLYVHLAVDHQGAHDGDHDSEISDLLRAATHGHHHEAEAAPRHEHDVRLGAPAPVVRSVSLLVAVLPAWESPPTRLSARALLDGSPRRAPPDPLFAAHCSLLL